jgi:hypothetical protein
MKKIIVTLSLAGFISLGFTVVGSNKYSEQEGALTVKNATSEKQIGLNDNNDKRLASWD